jgi:hypothetical protein
MHAHKHKETIYIYVLIYLHRLGPPHKHTSIERLYISMCLFIYVDLNPQNKKPWFLPWIWSKNLFNAEKRKQ